MLIIFVLYPYVADVKGDPTTENVQVLALVKIKPGKYFFHPEELR